jgi:hypothetical protein
LLSEGHLRPFAELGTLDRTLGRPRRMSIAPGIVAPLVVPALRRQRQEGCKFEASLGHTANPVSKIKNECQQLTVE